MATSLKAKLDRIFEGSRFERLLIMNTGVQDSNFKYLTGFTSGIHEQAILIADHDGAVLLTNPLEEEIAKKQAPKSIKVKSVRQKELIKELGTLKGSIISINESFIPVSYLKFIKRNAKPKSIVDASKELAKARSIKQQDEISYIRKAVRITKLAISETIENLEEGMSELDVAALFDYNQKKLGSEPSFPSIVAFGPNASMPHYMPGKRKLFRNTAVLLDVGGIQNNYCSDISRTLIFKPDRNSRSFHRLSDMIMVVKEAQQLALEQMYDGNSASAPHRAALAHIESHDNGIYKGRFIHALGHSIGIDVHDGLTIPSKGKLEKNMVFSDEPGIYIPGFGGVRFEEDVIIGKKPAFI